MRRASWRPTRSSSSSGEFWPLRKLHQKTDVLDARDANLAGSVFENVDLAGAKFRDVRLTGCTVENANLRSARIFDADLSGLVISGCRLDDMTIDGVRVSDLFEAYMDWREAAR